MNFWLLAALVFFSYMVIDWLYVKYTLSVTARHPMRSAFYGSVIHLIGAFGILSYTQYPGLIFAVFFGGWIGTYTSVRYHSTKVDHA